MDNTVQRISARPPTQAPVARAQADSAASGEDFAQYLQPLGEEEARRRKKEGQGLPPPPPPPTGAAAPAPPLPHGALYPDEEWLEDTPPGQHLDRRA